MHQTFPSSTSDPFLQVHNIINSYSITNMFENCFWRPSSMEASFCKIQNSYFYISIFFEKNTDIHGGIMYMCVNFQNKIRWNEGRVKKQIWGFLTHGTIHPQSPEICLFCTGRISRYFILNFYTHIHFILVYLHIFFSIFSETRNFDFFKNKGLHGARSPNRHSPTC